MGAYKTFQEILNEQMQGTQPSVPSQKSETLPPLIEFDFSFLKRPAAPISATGKAYPKSIAPTAAPTAAPTPVATPAQDLKIAVSKLMNSEVAAIRTLGIETLEYLSRNEVKMKYRALVRKFHPDRHPMGLSANERRALTEKFYLILESHDILSEAFARLA